MLFLRSSLLALAVLATVACGSDSKTDPNPPPPPVDPGPASVKILSFSETNQGLATVHLHNNGGPGVFKLAFYSVTTSPAGGQDFYGETDAVEVGTGYDESPSYQVRTFFDPPVGYVLAFTRQPGSAIYQESDSFPVPR